MVEYAKCPKCKTQPQQKSKRMEKHDTYIPLGLVKVYKCEHCGTYHAVIETYEEIQND